MKKQRMTRKDLLLLGSVFAGLLSLVLILPEDDQVVSEIILAVSAIVSLVVVPRLK